MSAPVPKTTDQWVIKQFNKESFDKALEFQKDVPIPELGDNEVLVHIQAVSMNYRDLIITKVDPPQFSTTTTLDLSSQPTSSYANNLFK